MTYLTDLLARARGVAEAKAAPRALRMTDYGDPWAPPQAESAERQARLYTQLSWLQIAAETKANTVATTALQVYQRTDEGQQGVANHPFELLLDRPNPDASRFEFLRDTSLWLDVTGECYWWRNRASATAPDDEIWIIPSPAMEPLPDGQGGIRAYRYDPGDGQAIMLEPWEVVYHKTWNPLSRLRGLSAVGALALGAQADVAAQRYNLSFFDRDNAKADGVLAFSDNIPDDVWHRLMEENRDKYGGTKNRRVMMLRNVGPGGVQWITTHISRADMQFLESRTFTKEEIFARVAPGLASVLAVNATEANSTAGMNTFLGMAVFPRCVAIAQKVSLVMLGEGEIAEFDDVRRVDTETEIKQQQSAALVMTVNEVRERYYSLPPIGDERGAMLVAAAQSAQPAAEPAPDALTMAGKALDRRRWQAKALKALAAGRSPDVPFTPEWLDEDEAMVIRGALRRGDVGAAFGGGEG